MINGYPPDHYLHALSKPTRDALLLRAAAFDEPDIAKSHQLYQRAMENLRIVAATESDAVWFSASIPTNLGMENMQTAHASSKYNMRTAITLFHGGDPSYIDAACGNDIIDKFTVPDYILVILTQLGFPNAIALSYRRGLIGPVNKYLTCLESKLFSLCARSSLENLWYTFKVLRICPVQNIPSLCFQIRQDIHYDRILNRKLDSYNDEEYDYNLKIILGYSILRDRKAGIVRTAPRFSTSAEAVSVYNDYLAAFKSRVDAWLICARRLGFSKDIRAVIAKLIYGQMYM